MIEFDAKTKIIIQDRGISATHPIILHKKGDKVIICSVASPEGNSSFDYSIVFDGDKLLFDKSDKEIVDIICQTENHSESKWGHQLAIEHGIKPIWIVKVLDYIKIQNQKLIRLSRNTRLNRIC